MLACYLNYIKRGVNMINISDLAKVKIYELLDKQENKELCLRLGILGGGCSGFSWTMDLDTAKEGDETVIERVITDPVSWGYLKGSNIDYAESIQGSGFSIDVASAKRSCGCGKSFSMT